MALLYLLLRELRSNVELLSNSVPLTSLFLKGRKVTVSVIILTLSGNHTNGPLISRDVEKRRGGRRIEIRPPLHRVCRPLALGEAFSLGCKFVHHLCDCDAIPTKYSSQCDTSKMSFRRLWAFSMLLGNDRPIFLDAKINTHEKRETQVNDRSVHRLGPASH